MNYYVKALVLLTEVNRLIQLADDTLVLALLAEPLEIIGGHVGLPEADVA